MTEWKHLQWHLCECDDCLEVGEEVYWECCELDGKWVSYACYENTDKDCPDCLKRRQEWNNRKESEWKTQSVNS
jgi:hypothetical protein